MKAVILGAGVWGNDESFPPSVLVDAGGELILFDCGEGIRFRIFEGGYDVTDIEHVAITETHPDHYALIQLYQAMHCKGFSSDRRGKKLFLYVPQQLKDKWKDVWNCYLPELEGKFEYEFPKLKWNVMKNGSNKNINDKLKLTSYGAKHAFGRVETLIYRLECDGKIFAYVGDSGPCEGLANAARNADLFICEASCMVGEKNHEYGHLNPREVGEAANNAGVKHLVVTHYFGLESDDAIMKDVKRSGFRGKVTVAKDLMEFAI